MHFPDLDEVACARLEKLGACFREWNAKHNLVSRKDIDGFERHHVLPSLALLRMVLVPERVRVLDVGTGGGLPGLPLAIACPRAKFFLLDSVQKKCSAIRAMADELGLTNVEVVNKRAERIESSFDLVLGRAVAPLGVFLGWIGKNVRAAKANTPGGRVYYWKGTLYREELEALGLEAAEILDLQAVAPDPYLEGKFIVRLDYEQLHAKGLTQPQRG